MSREKVVGLLVAGFALVATAKTPKGGLERVETVAENELRYKCTIQNAKQDLKYEVTLNTASLLFTVDMPDAKIKGFASETLEKETGDTYYFLQGGSAPLSQRLTLVTRENGKWARFSRAYGAGEFICEM